MTPEVLVEAVIAGDLVMGYTDPFASSTGLNFLLTVLDSIAEGDPARLASPDVASVFEQFQRQVPFVALTTLQMRDSVANDTGTLDAFVMEWQTYANTESLQTGYEFIPFGVRHDNPLYTVGDLTPSQSEALEAFAAFAEQPQYQQSAAEFGFDPPAFEPTVEVPSGSTLIDVQNVWKDKKDGGRPVATVFVVDTSGSMEGTRIGRPVGDVREGANSSSPRPASAWSSSTTPSTNVSRSPSSTSTQQWRELAKVEVSARAAGRQCTTGSCSG